MDRRLLSLLGVPKSACERWARAGQTTAGLIGHRDTMAAARAAAAEGGGALDVEITGPIRPEAWAWLCDGGTSSDDVRAALDGAGDVRLRIQSPGGDVWEAAAIYSMLLEHREAGHAVTARIDGLAASAATLIMLAATDIEAVSMADLMIHEVCCCMCGGAEDLARAGEWAGQKDRDLATLYAARMTGGIDEILAEMRGERWYTAREAREAGLIDRVVETPAPDYAAAAFTRRDLRLALATT